MTGEFHYVSLTMRCLTEPTWFFIKRSDDKVEAYVSLKMYRKKVGRRIIMASLEVGYPLLCLRAISCTKSVG